MNSAELYGRFEKSQARLRKKHMESVRNSACNNLRTESAVTSSGVFGECIIRFPGEKEVRPSCEDLAASAARSTGDNSQSDAVIVQEDGIFRINTDLLPSRPVFNEDFKELVDSVLKEPYL
jgi:hypothetical protein